MKKIFLIFCLSVLTLSVTVTDKDTCSLCVELRSQNDCESKTMSLGCEWKSNLCQQETTNETILEYCQTITDPAVNCAKTFGCAFENENCTHFSGCTGYPKTTSSECQLISTSCTTNGITCDDIKHCQEYKTEATCQITPVSPYKCKWENDVCRDYKCTEADISLSTDSDCNNWLNGCLTTGMGCTDVRKQCAEYTGSAEICNKMIGQDGKCTSDKSNDKQCKVRACSEAVLTTWDQTTCNNYQTGCKPTGFNCVDFYVSCISYTGTSTTCLNFIGSEGKCAFDSTTTKCKGRKCEDKLSGKLSDCTSYKDGCITNGVACVTLLGNCNSYKGTTTTCLNYIGSDGNCKGTSATDSTASCSLKTCADDDQGTETTDTACQLVQSNCKTTGKGCVSSLQSCTTYTDDGNCLNYIGSDGKCKAGSGGDSPKCAVRVCTDNTTSKSNTECQTYKPGCVTNGAGCIQEASCSDTVNMLACQGTTNNYTCGWTASCLVKDCTVFSSNQSLCKNTKLSDSQPCIWETTSTSCKNAECGDYIETDDYSCDSHMQGCITNGVKCADPDNCDEFQGNMTMCRGFIKAYCTNIDDSILATTACIARTCTDTNITATSDSDCSSYLSGCIYAGANKCISDSSDCTGYFGTSIEECEIFTGYLNLTTRSPCWWYQGSTCSTKVCTLAKDMTKDTDCETFLTGCVYDGNGSCVDASSTCTSFKYASNASDCQALKGINGTQKCFDGSSNSCKIRACSDALFANYSDTQCNIFLPGCLSKGTGCVEPTTECSSYQGTSEQCSNFKGNSIACYRALACSTQPVACANKKNATTNSQCVAYKATCMLTFGTTTCQDQAATCAGYTFAATAVAADKTTYCNQVQATGGVNCSYDPATTETCVVRSCALWSSSLGISCTSYAGASSCSYANNVCYTPSTCISHTIPGTVAAEDKITYCNKFQDSNNKKCTFNSTVSATTCKTMNKCEEALSPTVQDDCYDQTGQSNCVLIVNACVTIKSACTGYDISGFNGLNQLVEKGTFCMQSKSVNLSVYTACFFSPQTRNTCVDITCEKVAAEKQLDCNIASLTNCHFYTSKCYTRKECTQYDISTEYYKQKFCQNMYNGTANEFCSYDSSTSTSTCGVPKSCTEYPLTTLALCQEKRDKTGVICTFVTSASNCSIPTAPGEICTLITTGIIKHSDCDLQTTPNACVAKNSACVLSQDCTSVIGSNLEYCQGVRDPNGYYCTWTTANKCEAGKNSCTDWTGASSADCTSKQDKNGNGCDWVSGAETCSNAITCEDAASPKSQADCDLISTGCIFYNSQCLKNADECTLYDVSSGFTGNAKFTYCNGRITTSGDLCTYKDSSNSCVAIGACSSYTAVGADATKQITYCQNLLTTDNFGCTYLTGANCSEVPDSCTAYTVTAAADCASLKDTMGRACGGTTTTCAYPDCSTVSSPNGQSDCDAKMPGCIFYLTKCITVAACSTYTTGGSGAKAFCGGIKDTNGALCTADNDSDANCKARTCLDAAASYFTTHKECQDYSPFCKSDGLGCVSITEACSTFNASDTQCSWFLDQTGQNNCVAPVPASDTQNCTPMTCELNVAAANQTDCDNFIVGGGCRWKNPGCFDKSVSCNQYRGTSEECSNFIVNGIQCYSDSLTRDSCRDLTCEDKSTATDDNECKNFLSSCVFNGVGCIDKSSDCTQFQGTSITCKKYRGNNGTTLCWSNSTDMQSCADKQCTDQNATTDPGCEANLPGRNCITDGTNCVQGPKNCADFKGNNDLCSRLTAVDGPCKATSSNQCTQRICNEAPFTYTTDQQCQDYHPTCKTNGKGCQLIVACEDYQIQNACAANPTCLWTNSCRLTSTNCSTLTKYGQSVCTNNPTKYCAWSNNTCREYTCNDYDSAFNNHEACMMISNNTCTTTGAGCVTYGICSSYKLASICSVAQSTETTTKKCVWESAQCRKLQCKDLKGKTDTECNQQLAGCKSNGTVCIGPSYDCSIFNGAQKFCLIDSQGQPCLYVDGICYPYDNCTDIPSSDQQFCQLVSSQCVAGLTSCIPLNQCSNYENQISCVIGTNKTICGWLPEQKCAQFNKCSDAKGTTLSDCKIWNNSCVSDGSVCVDIDECSSYLKETACLTDKDKNPCYWVNDKCRLKSCSDYKSSSDAECIMNIAKEGICTTDGTNCVLRAECSSYSKDSCTIGSNSIPCFFDSVAKSCREKECTDILGTSNDKCKGMINKKECVSNGKNCIAQGACASYNNKVSCVGGGTDNSICVFTAVPTTTDSLAGTCQPFISCTSANGDSATCALNQSCKYVQATKQCQTTDCTTFNPSGKCNPIPDFAGKVYTICVNTGKGCEAGDPLALVQADCYSNASRYTRTWNSATMKCQSCKTEVINNYESPNLTTETEVTSQGFMMSILIVLQMLIV